MTFGLLRVIFKTLGLRNKSINPNASWTAWKKLNQDSRESERDGI